MKKLIALCLLVFLSTYTKANCCNSDHNITVIKSTVGDIKHCIKNLSVKETKHGLTKKQVFYKDKEIVLIRFTEEDTAQSISYVKDWYFDCRRIIYAEQNIYVLNTTKSIDFEAMYFINEKLSQWLFNNRIVDDQSKNFMLTSIKLEDYIWKMKVENGIVEA
jgi:hypothetical protein